MPATFEWDEANGAGETVTHNVTQVNWKNIDDVASAYTSYPITDGNNSFEKWQYGHFTASSFNNILNGRFAHTAGGPDTGVTLKGQPSMTVDADRLAYATPSTTTNASLTVDMTAVTAIGSGQVVWFGATGPAAAGKLATQDGTVDRYTNYLTTQMQTSGASPGDTSTMTMTLQYDEN